MKKGNFKIFGHLVFRCPNEYYYIEIRRGKHISLKTKDEEKAKRIALQVVQEILNNKIISVEKKENPTLLDYLDIYLGERTDLAKGTIALDRTAVKMFSRIVGNKRMVKLIDQDGTNFKEYYIKKNVSKFTFRTYYRHLDCFFRHAIKNPNLDFNKSPLPKNVKKPKRLPKVLKKEERSKLSDYFKNNDYELWRIFQFAIYTGLRREEIHNLEWKHFTPKKHKFLAGSIKVIGKGDKERTVRILKQAFFAMHKPGIGRIFKQWHVDNDLIASWM